MALWEYKVITSGKGGFATPALLEKFLNDLGRDEWEIVHFQTPPENFLAFTGVVRRSTQRDWTLQDAAAAAAKAEAEKLRAEFEAKFKAAASSATAAAGAGEERVPSFVEEKAAPDDGFRKPVDTSRDDDPEAQEDDKSDDWDKLTAAEEDDLPTFFEAIKPHLRRNQRGLGMSVGVDYLAKKWDQSEEDLKGALVDCGFVVPADEDSKPEYIEYDGDLFWLNINRRGELWINTKEKPRPVFRTVRAQKVVMEEPTKPQPEVAAEPSEKAIQRSEVAQNISGGVPAAQFAVRAPKPAHASAELPAGTAMLDKIRPHMRRNRRGPGGSGSTTFLARALRANEADLRAAFVALGLVVPTSPADKPVYVEIGGDLWWLNLDSRGGLWINGREKKEGETAESANDATAEAASEAESVSAPAPEASVPSLADSPIASAAGMGSARQTEPVRAESGSDFNSGETPLASTDSVREDERSFVSKRREHEPAETAETAPPTSERSLTGAGIEANPSAPAEAARSDRASASEDTASGANPASSEEPGPEARTRFPAEDAPPARSPQSTETLRPAADSAAGEGDLTERNSTSRNPADRNPADGDPGDSDRADGDSTERNSGRRSATARDASTGDAAEGDSAGGNEWGQAGRPSSEGGQSVSRTRSGDAEISANPPEMAAPEFAPVESTRQPEPARTESTSVDAQAAESPPHGDPVLVAARLLLKETRAGAVTGKVAVMAEELRKSPDEFLALLVGAGLKVPEKPREKPIFVEHVGEILWLNRNAKGEVMLNAKASKYADKEVDPDEPESPAESAGEDGEKKTVRRGGRGRTKKAE